MTKTLSLSSIPPRSLEGVTMYSWLVTVLLLASAAYCSGGQGAGGGGGGGGRGGGERWEVQGVYVH